MASARYLSADEVSAHNKPDDCWIVVEGQIWDLTEFAPEHPGGAKLILKLAGKDATREFNEIHTSSLLPRTLTNSKLMGRLDPSSILAISVPNVASKQHPTIENEAPPLTSIISTQDFILAAPLRLTPKAYAYYSSAATDLVSFQANSALWSRIWFRPRLLRNVRTVDTSCEIQGVRSSLPVLCAPAAMAKLAHPDGEKGIARACERGGIIQCASINASYSIEEIVDAEPYHPFFFQIYVNKDRSSSEQLLKRVWDLGIRVLFLTIDAPVPGKREADERVKIEGSGKIVLKGVQSVEDVKIAVEEGIDGVVLSNHGGRNLDTSPPSLLVLLELRRHYPEAFNKMEVYVDGGIRRGTDILKALCLGAKAVLLGRPFLYSMAYGEEGVDHLISILRDELETAMRLLGVTSLSHLHPGLVNTQDIDHLVVKSLDATTGFPQVKARI
ncbi:hypothetical protein B7494_g604 [Chlorociboria aeruginascens]|nr:hypothetical protein B7494_g604 [Chlorociboria aeruginascens]